MSVWIRNLQMSLEDRLVIVLHGNVRDKYIDEHGRIYDNLTSLLTEVARSLPLSFSELVFYDPIDNERRIRQEASETPPPQSGNSELDATAPERAEQPIEKRLQPTQVLFEWNRQLAATDQNRFVTFFYLDKLVSYNTSYQDNEKEALLRLEKVIENITGNNRLVLVALQDTLVPIELYTNSPKTYVLPIPAPDKEDRKAYFKHLLGTADFPDDRLELISDLTDGLYLRDIDNIARDLREEPVLTSTQVRRIINKYRIGEKEDYWGTLSIRRLDDAKRWFIEEEGIKGQDEAIERVKDQLCLVRAGLSGIASGTGAKPKGILFFAGPTGVGKTFSAKKLAKFLFSTEEAFLRFDMSEFKEEHTVSKLIGSPPGYVGYERGGMLTNSVRERPFSVILFDEIEKAHPKIMDIFLQILDEGRLTDSRGQTVFFTETIIIFTSNLGTRETDSRGNPVKERANLEKYIGYDAEVDDFAMTEEERKEHIRNHFIQCVEQFFTSEISRPELLNRIGSNIVPFNFIHTAEVQQNIVRSHLKRIKAEVEERHRVSGHQLEFDDNVAVWMVEQHGERISIFGGRAIGDIIEREALRPLAFHLLRAEEQKMHAVCFRVETAPDGERLMVKEVK